MVKRGCNFDERERKTLLRLYDIVRALELKIDYVIESQKDLYYRIKTEDWDDEGVRHNLCSKTIQAGEMRQPYIPAS